MAKNLVRTAAIRKDVESKTAADQINDEHSQLTHDLAFALRRALRIGRLLSKQREKTPRGEWTDWIEANLVFGVHEARRYIRVYQNRARVLASEVTSLRGAVDLLSERRPVLSEFREIDGHFLTLQQFEFISARAQTIKAQLERLRDSGYAEIMERASELMEDFEMEETQLIGTVSELNRSIAAGIEAPDGSFEENFGGSFDLDLQKLVSRLQRMNTILRSLPSDLAEIIAPSVKLFLEPLRALRERFKRACQ